jgi:hypothetical protein
VSPDTWLDTSCSQLIRGCRTPLRRCLPSTVCSSEVSSRPSWSLQQFVYMLNVGLFNTVLSVKCLDS